MKLCIRLDLQDPRGKLKLETAGKPGVHGDIKAEVDLPFDAQETSIVARALDINADVKRRFSAEDAAILQMWGVLVRPSPLNEAMFLEANDLHREKLRALVHKRLYDALLKPLEKTLNACFVHLHDQGETPPVLHIHLEMWSDQVALFQFPWELLHTDNSLGGEIQLSRYICYPRALAPLKSAPSLRLLVLHSEPQDLPPLGLQDKAKIEASLAQASQAGAIQLEFLDSVSLRRLSDALARQPEQPTLIHFAGHGDFGRRCEQCGHLTLEAHPTQCKRKQCAHAFPSGVSPAGYLAFTHPKTGRPQWISAEEFCATLKLGDVRLVVLNACKSALGRRGEDIFNGLAQRLMDSVPAVVATPFPLDNAGAEEFARCFFEALANGHSLVSTLHQVRLRMYGDYPDEWYRPVLYLRSNQQDGGCLLEPVVVHGAGVPSVPTQELVAYLVDYKDQEQEFHRRIRNHRGRDKQGQKNPARRRPLVLVMPGWADDTTAGMLLDRMLYDLQDRLGGYDDNYKTLESTRLRDFAHLNCTGRESEEELASVLLQSIRDELFGAYPIPDDPHEALAYLRRRTLREPVIFYAHLDLSDLHRRGAEAFLRCFYQFWGHWVDQNHLLLVYAFVSYLKEPSTLWGRAVDHLFQGHHRINEHFEKHWDAEKERHTFDPPNYATNIQGKVLPTLKPVCKNEVKHWAWRMKRRGLLHQPRTLNQLLEKIEWLFADGSTLIDGCLPMNQVCRRLDEFLMQSESGSES
jgi:CHAT domain-containing protein